ncbi:MAG: sporulation transcriptional regulator SpoIIID [Clostridia bacterium]|nr:sporulation transcriptional regulator SpoIIID [Clostridia bacterium]
MMYIASDKERCVALAVYLVENRTTVRATAKRFGISKSTVHKDVTEVLRHVDPVLYGEVCRVLETNKQERHLRGGEATRQKYLSEQAGQHGCAPHT